MSKLAQGCVAEFLGTFALVFFGVGSIILTQPATGGAGSLVTVALAHGLILSIFVTACMYVSGAQFNPAVSIALAVIGKQSGKQAAAFILAQLLAAACGAGLWQLVLGPGTANADAVKLGATIGSLTVAGDTPAVLGIEVVLTFALMVSILMGTVDERAHKLGGFTIGLTVAACILAAGPLTGASMNPARTFGPALCGRHWDMHWVYWAAPLLGATAAALVYRSVWAAPRAR
ncbi:MAG: aquaporin [Phycisphaerales bacterium]